MKKTSICIILMSVLLLNVKGLVKADDTDYGLTIPSGHPRLWFTPERLQQARDWFQINPFTPSGSAGHDIHVEQALHCLLSNDAAMCRTAIDWAMSVVIPVPGGNSCNDCRWYGEAALLTYDWAYDHMTPSERSTFITNWNSYLSNWMTKQWGGTTMPMNNYFWGYLRNELEWGIASYGENPQAETFLQDALVTRWQDAFLPNVVSAPGGMGGVPIEGNQYGKYLLRYQMIPFLTSSLYGRTLYSETDFFSGTVLFLVYATTPTPTTSGGSTAYEVFPWNDDQFFRNGGSALAHEYGDFMTTMSNYWPDMPLGQFARRWLNMTGASRSPEVRSLDLGGAELDFTSLPLDYYAPGPHYFYGRTNWGSVDVMLYHLQLGVLIGQGHFHDDYSNWQLWRNGRWLSRETTSYAETFTGYAGSGTLSSNHAGTHNSLLFNGAGFATPTYWLGWPIVNRLESRAGYSYAQVDLSNAYRALNRPQVDNPAVSHVEREFIFIRPLETMVIFDRLESNAVGTTPAEGIPKTFLAHFEQNPAIEDSSHVTAVNGDQALRLTTLLPGNQTYRVVNEAGAVGQYRLEVDASGSAQTYFLHVLQGRGVSDPNLDASVVDNGSSYTAILVHPTKGTVTMIFNKGMSSTGGSITIAGQTYHFLDRVQGITVTDNGPVWEQLYSSPTLAAGAASGNADTDIDIPVTFTSGDTDVASLQFDVTLPAGLDFVSVSDGAAAVAAGKMSMSNLIGSTLRVLVFGFNSTPIDSGPIAIVRLHIAPGTPAGTLALPMSGVVFSDPLGTEVPGGSPTDGSVTVTASPTITYGDVSGNGTVSAYDASLTAQHAAGLITLTPEQITKAEVSGNGTVSAYDASLIAQKAAGLIDKFPIEP